MTNGSAEVRDLDSHNGTIVNSIPVSKRLLGHGDVLRVGQSELVFLTEADSPAIAPRALFGEGTSTDILKTIKLNDSTVWSPSPTDVGRMARDLNALVKISQTINSIRDPDALQETLLECVFEVVPADFGAILVLDHPDEEPTSICTFERDGRDSPPVSIRRELVQRALWERSIVLTDEPPGPQLAENVMCAPLVGVQRTIGVLYLTSSGGPEREV